MNMHTEDFLSHIWEVLRYIQFYVCLHAGFFLILEKGIRRDH